MKYPPRPKPETTDIYCECGHDRWDHEGSWYNFYSYGSGKCEECMCPKFKSTIRKIIRDERQNLGDVE